jgi:hypothetical protein
MVHTTTTRHARLLFRIALIAVVVGCAYLVLHPKLAPSHEQDDEFGGEFEDERTSRSGIGRKTDGSFPGSLGRYLGLKAYNNHDHKVEAGNDLTSSAPHPYFLPPPNNRHKWNYKLETEHRMRELAVCLASGKCAPNRVKVGGRSGSMRWGRNRAEERTTAEPHLSGNALPLTGRYYGRPPLSHEHLSGIHGWRRGLVSMVYYVYFSS